MKTKIFTILFLALLVPMLSFAQGTRYEVTPTWGQTIDDEIATVDDEVGIIGDSLVALIERQVIYKVVVDGELIANTAFGDGAFSGFQNDYFSDPANWCVYIFSATEAGIVGEVRLITDFVATNGVFTTADIGAAYTVDDVILIVPRSMFPEGNAMAARIGDLTDATTPEVSDGTETVIGMLRGLVDRGQAYRVVVDNGSGSGTAFGDADFASFPNDYFDDYWSAYVFSATNITPGTGTIRYISNFVSTNGVFTVSATFGANTADGDVIYIVPRVLFPEGTNVINRMGDVDATAVYAPSATASQLEYLKGIMVANGYVPGTTDTTPLGSMDLWTTTGPIIIHEIIGIVTTTDVAGSPTTIQIAFDPDDAGANVDLDAGAYDATGIATGTIIRMTGDKSDNLIATLDVAEAPGYEMNARGVVLSQAGDILVTYGATTAGQINWFIKYTSLGGIVTGG